MIRERILRIMIGLSIFISLITTISFIYFIDQFPTMQAFSLTVKHIDFKDGSFIINNSLTWMYILVGFNVLTFGLAIFFFKPKDKKLIELSLYNIVVSALFIVGLFWYISMFPETIPSLVTHKMFYSSFVVDGEVFKAVNIIYVVALIYFALNVVFFSLPSED